MLRRKTCGDLNEKVSKRHEKHHRRNFKEATKKGQKEEEEKKKCHKKKRFEACNLFEKKNIQEGLLRWVGRANLMYDLTFFCVN